MSEVLTDNEIIEVTGFKRAKRQKEWLLKNGWPFSTKRNGRPSVHRLVLRAKLGVSIESNGLNEEKFIIDLTRVG